MIIEAEFKSKLIKRFWSKIKFGLPNECWEWQSYLRGRGYGGFQLSKKQQSSAHRYAYAHFFNDFDENLDVLHRCDNRKCVNPNHLWQGTNNDNVQDKMKKGRHKSSIGSRHGMAKLTEDDVILIKLRLACGETQKTIAEAFRVDETLISCINTGKNWKHVQI